MSIRLQPGPGDPVYLINVTAGSESFPLPRGFAPGRTVTYKRLDNTTNTATITVPSGESLDGVTDGTAVVGGNASKVFTVADPTIWESFGGISAQEASGTYAPLASAALTGSPTAPTPTAGDRDTSLATTAFVQIAASGAAAALAIVFGG